MTTVRDFSARPDAEFEAWLATVEARPAVNPDDDAREDAQRGHFERRPEDYIDLRIEDFDRRYRFRMVEAYPVISGVPDVYAATRDEIDAGFRYVLDNRNLRRTHELHLAAR